MTSRSLRALPVRLTALTLAAVLALAAAGYLALHADHPSPLAASAADTSPTPSRTPASAPPVTLHGQNHLALTITSARRAAAGVLTLRGTLANTGRQLAVVPAELRGNETAILKTGPSLAGATLVDFTAGKRYYVLRDTDNQPLTTTGLSTLKAGESVRIFLQFPAPPATTTYLDLELPLFDTATLTLTR
ncbi:hypothetical protein [Streptomyces mangrovisoli]|uniref:DUF4352 domain-containing protein n=1 Tax=Streptomyces mangrovisoli TaxID=1428628 RepID=A0A1J4NTU1_9ACTN|nr:hypothetical protein [Streptomyces mangrovisoli]OIJ64964.1 hypothetical protein WN71_026110 [Streptomyces mangrovisoli]